MVVSPANIGRAEICLPCETLAPCLDFFVRRLGFRIETIFPADAPRVASLSGHGLNLRLAPGGGDPGVIRLVTSDLSDRPTTAPNGTRLEWVEADAGKDRVVFEPAFMVTRRKDGPLAGQGRAGMSYRDLIPGRLGGSIIASHISIPDGGPVADWVHFHKIRFQMIFCRRGWVRVVYEDQGDPFVMQAGDLVLQPPCIRHRVLESSAGLEVVEIGCPALHETLADHGLDLPTGRHEPQRDFSGQTFLRHIADQTPWNDLGGGRRLRDMGLDLATSGLAQAAVLSGGGNWQIATEVDALVFGFVLQGEAVLEHLGGHPLGPDDAFVIPPGGAWSLCDAVKDFSWLRVKVGVAVL